MNQPQVDWEHTDLGRSPGTKIQAYLADRLPAMIDLLARLVSLESPSDVPAAQAPLLAVLAAELEAVGLEVTLLPGERTGGHLLARPAGDSASVRGQLLVGHADTVWPVGTLARMPLVVEDERLRGPGVLDMKAGLVAMIFALQALRDLKLTPAVPPFVVINTDEEIGSPESTPHIARLAARMDRALVLEPAHGPAGKLKTARKGTGDYRLKITGRAAHAGLAPEDGINAIMALAAMLPAIDALNDPDNGVTVNVGVIHGGVRPNVVPAVCEALVDVRVPTAVDGRRVDAALRALRPGLPGTTLELEGGIERLPLERTPANQALWRHARGLAATIGLAIEETAVGGASDGNTTSQYTATLDGLGPVGAGAHADHEHVLVASLPERAALLTLLLLAPPMADLDDER